MSDLRQKFEDPDLQKLLSKLEGDLVKAVMGGKNSETRELAHAEWRGLKSLKARMIAAIKDDEKKGNSL